MAWRRKTEDLPSPPPSAVMTAAMREAVSEARYRDWRECNPLRVYEITHAGGETRRISAHGYECEGGGIIFFRLEFIERVTFGYSGRAAFSRRVNVYVAFQVRSVELVEDQSGS